jgi:hypothetical protein
MENRGVGYVVSIRPVKRLGFWVVTQSEIWSFALQQKIPLLAEEGWPRHQINAARPPCYGADGVVSSAKCSGLKDFAELTTPPARSKVASLLLINLN